MRPDELILYTNYQGTVRPNQEYSSSEWATTAKSNIQSLYKVQNQVFCIITGTKKSTSLQYMEKVTGT